MTKMLKMAVIAAVLALGVSAVGAAVTIHHLGGTLTCTLTGSGMITSPAGGITMYCAEDLTTSGGGSTCTNQPPTISVSSPPASATVGTEVTASYSASDPEGALVNVSANVGSVDGSTWRWTPTSSASATTNVILTASDGQTCNAAARATFSINVTGTSGGGTVPPAGAEPLTPVKGTEVYAAERTIGSLATKYYYFVLPGPEAGGKSSYPFVQVSLGTWDWGTNQDMVVKLGEPPTAADIIAGVRMKSGPSVWYKIAAGQCAAYGTGVGGSNETVQMFNVPPGTYYVMVRNTCTLSGKFMLYYSVQ